MQPASQGAASSARPQARNHDRHMFTCRKKGCLLGATARAAGAVPHAYHVAPARDTTRPPSRLPARTALLLALVALAVAGCRFVPPPEAPPPKSAFPAVEPPPASRKDPWRQVYDPAQGCLTRAQAHRAERVLFGREPRADARRWLLAVNDALASLGVSCGDDTFLVLVLSVIQLESGVRADPPLAEPDLEALFVRRMERLRKDRPIAAGLISLAEIDRAVQAKLRRDTAAGRVRTEGQLVRYVREDLRPWLKAYLAANYPVPERLAGLASQRWVPDPVHTLGAMQVNAEKAWRRAKARGEAIESPGAMRALLLDPDTAIERGVKEGVALLWTGYAYYRGRLPRRQAARYAGVDFNAGEFSARNAAFQGMLSRLLGESLALDGDLLAYDDEGAPREAVSRTEAAVRRLLPEYGPAEIRRALRAEKRAAFSDTAVAREVCRRYRARSGGRCPVARVPTGAGNPDASIKLGRAYTPQNYARALHGRLRRNLRGYAAADPRQGAHTEMHSDG